AKAFIRQRRRRVSRRISTAGCRSSEPHDRDPHGRGRPHVALRPLAEPALPRRPTPRRAEGGGSNLRGPPLNGPYRQKPLRRRRERDAPCAGLHVSTSKSIESPAPG